MLEKTLDSGSNSLYWRLLTIRRYSWFNKKIPSIPLLINNKLESDFTQTANHFNKFLPQNAHQLTIIRAYSRKKGYACHFPEKGRKRAKYLKNWPKMCKIWKHFEKGQVTVCNYHTQQTARIDPIDTTLPMPINFNSTTSLNEINFNDEDILKIIQGLNFNKAHGHDNWFMRMIEICDLAIIGPLSTIFRNCIVSGIFPDIWKIWVFFQYTRKETNYC